LLSSKINGIELATGRFALATTHQPPDPLMREIERQHRCLSAIISYDPYYVTTTYSDPTGQRDKERFSTARGGIITWSSRFDRPVSTMTMHWGVSCWGWLSFNYGDGWSQERNANALLCT
jgi:hypothetical protein